MPREPEELEPDEVADARALELGARLDDDDFELFDPPSEVWEGIAARLHDDAAESAAADDAADTDETAADRSSTDPQRVVGAPPVVLADRRRVTWKLAAAAAIVVALIAGGVLWSIRNTDAPTRTIASASLKVLEGSATADARLVEQDGKEVLIIDAHNMPAAPAGSHFELWLADRALKDPRSLGPMTGSTRVTVPKSIDTSTYDVVDISLQPDTLHRHSGHSLLRGALT